MTNDYRVRFLAQAGQSELGRGGKNNEQQLCLDPRRSDAVSNLGSLFRQRRDERGLTTAQLARLLGYRNVTKGCNRIGRFEDGGKVAPDLLAGLSEALEVTPDEIRRSLDGDYKEWLAWADEPVRPYVVLRYMACVYSRVELPDDALSPEAAEVFASQLARERKLMVCLVVSRRLSIRFDSTGKEYQRLDATPDLPCEPYAIIGGRRVQFDFTGGEVIRPLDEPGR
jgi:transcriptional regulator with XRE-family HTH domain